jgi:HAE1 family hydrophobic/amphiphilic exporter-1
MTSFAFIAGLLPLVFATGAGAIGNRTIGTTGAGGMLVGTVIGVLIIPGLYYMFGRLADGRHILKDETNAPLSEYFERHPLEMPDSDHDLVLPNHASSPDEPDGDLPEASEIPPEEPPDSYPPSNPHPPPGEP